jgi:hypothetical protein
MSILDAAPLGHVLGDSSGLDTDMLLKRMKADLHPGQLAFVEDQESEILAISAGYGAGKTRSLLCKAVSLAIANQGFTGCVMEPTGPMIRDIWISEFDSYLEQYEIPYSFRASPLPNYTLHLPGGDTHILCRSYENVGRIVGVNLSHVIVDEVDTVQYSIAAKAFPKILGRLRSGHVRQFAVASTPEGFRWLYNEFGSPEAQQRTDRKLIRMRTQDNPHLPADFIERLKANYDPTMLQAYLNGEFVNLNTGQVYDRFDREKHLCTPAKYEDEPWHVGLDFNVANMSAVIGVRDADKIFIVDEISGSHDTDSLAQEIKRRAGQRSKIYIYPDASGGNRSTNATRTDIEILQSYGFINQSGRSNPPVRDRVSTVQAALENGKGEVRLQVAKHCTKLIECLELQSWTEAGDPDKDAGYDHMVDALGYLVWKQFSLLEMRAGRSTGFRIY